jgi:uncharacterized protein
MRHTEFAAAWAVSAALAVLAVFALAGCGSSPKVEFYTLSSATAPPGTTAAAAYVVAIGPVTVPEAVDRPQFVTRAAGNQVAIDEFARWAAPLRSEIPRVIAANLAQLLNGARVFAYPQGANVEADCKVLIDVQRFDSVPGDAAAVEVLWTVRPVKGGAQKAGRSAVREPAGGPGYDALAAAHGRALSAVSRDIAEAIREAMRGETRLKY